MGVCARCSLYAAHMQHHFLRDPQPHPPNKTPINSIIVSICLCVNKKNHRHARRNACYMHAPRTWPFLDHIDPSRIYVVSIAVDVSSFFITLVHDLI